MWLLLHIVVSLALIVRVILKPHREPASRLAWTLVILILPAIGLAFGGGILAAIIHATIGAVILLFLIRLVKRI